MSDLSYWKVWVILKINIYIHHLSINWPKKPDTSTMLCSHNLCYFTAQCRIPKISKDPCTKPLTQCLISVSYFRDLLRLISSVTLADLQRVGTTYIAALFDETQARRAIVCNQSKVQEVVTSFKEWVPFHFFLCFTEVYW